MTLLPSLFSRRETANLDFWNNMNKMMDMMRRWPAELDGIGIPLDIEEGKDSYIVEADLPNVDKNEIEVSLDGRMLSIFVNKEKKEEKKERNYILHERSCATASRAIDLPLADEKQPVDASLKNGVLRIVVKKAPTENSRRIEIK